MSEFNELKIDGRVATPQDDDWDAARLTWNLTADPQPEAVAFVEGADDIAAVLRFAAANDLTVIGQGTGHAAVQQYGDLAGTIVIKTEPRVSPIDALRRPGARLVQTVGDDVGASLTVLAPSSSSTRRRTRLGDSLGGTVLASAGSTAPQPGDQRVVGGHSSPSSPPRSTSGAFISSWPRSRRRCFAIVSRRARVTTTRSRTAIHGDAIEVTRCALPRYSVASQAINRCTVALRRPSASRHAAVIALRSASTSAGSHAPDATGCDAKRHAHADHGAIRRSDELVAITRARTP